MLAMHQIKTGINTFVGYSWKVEIKHWLTREIKVGLVAKFRV